MLPGCQEVDDIMQDTNIVLWEKRDSYELGTNFKAWVYAAGRISVMKYRDKHKKLGMVMLSDELLQHISEEASSEKPGDNAPLDRKLTALRACMQKLNPVELSIVRARYHEEDQASLDYEQLSGKMGRPAGSLRVTLYRARRKLHLCVKRRINLGGKIE